MAGKEYEGKTMKHLITACIIFVTACLIFYCGLLSGCKPPRISMSGMPGRLSGGYSQEIVNGKEYYVSNSYFCPAYYDYEDWGIVVLSVADITDRKVVLSVADVVDWKTEFQPYHITSTNSRSQSIDLLIGGKNVPCQYEKNFVVVCYNDESGNCYRARLEMNDPKSACLFYRSDNKNRAELVDLWQQLNKEKDKHTVIFETKKNKEAQ